MSVGNKLKELRGERSQQEVAESLGISKSAYAMYEQDNRIPRDEVKMRIAKLFGVSVLDLFFADSEHK
jgi:transcriptional regulator with XRE-family HTH domain